jgi:hypothetical protein
VTAARSSDGPERRLLGFRGAESTVAAVADEDGACRPARLGSEKHRVGCEPSDLYPANGDDGVADEPVAVVHLEGEGHVLSTGAEEVPSDPCSRCRIVYAPGQVEPGLRHSVRVGCRPTGTTAQRSQE